MSPRVTPQNSRLTTTMPTGKRFVPGVSGNPGGRPKHNLLREFFDEAEAADEPARLQGVLEALYETATTPNHRDHMHAVELILAYTLGRPVQAVEVGDPSGGPFSVAPLLEAKLASMIDALAAVSP